MSPKRKASAPGKSKFSEADAQKVLREKSREVTPEDVGKVVENASELEKTFKTKGPFKKLVDDCVLLVSCLRDYWSGEYRDIPYYTIAAIVAALLYVLMPLDLIPDFIPVVGYVDDALVVAACLALVREDLARYREWKENKK